MGWVSASDGYEISLVGGRVTARSASGRVLKTLPKAVRRHPGTERLRRLSEWLERHAADCRARVDSWMMSSLPVPTALLVRVWPDEAWQSVLRDLVVVGCDEETGFLRDVTDGGELRLVDLDGETVRISPRTVRLPHPVLLPDLQELREFAAELGVTQGVEQIHRATWLKPDDAAGQTTEQKRYAGAAYPSRFALTARAASLGYRVSGAHATCPVTEGGRTAVATVWTGEPYYDDYEPETGPVEWQDAEGYRLRPGDVGPIAWSEGMRMAAALYAGRTVEEGSNR
ncbi:DUF4132 domain-containing protein [Streptomyces sp. HNM0663]|uniref:DUF4132 domain-containing protein n=1 Tax=Streptomyces chengmaiensis TaxID=3040919 RepID=A0ABT6HN89_9ACTN|nr:DUF4132 domain-containing protein [Streptomyces chengmaiensis]MDH2390187.1 DUF4132 domain-containing protein [Streptomyces chengmaiensis]